MITTMAGRDQKNDQSDGNTGSKEIFKMIALVEMLDQKKNQFYEAGLQRVFYLVNLILVYSILLVSFGKNEMR